MNKDFKVLMTTLGRSHFIVAASSLIKNGADVTLVQGWVPNNLHSLSVRIASKIIGRKSFVAGLAKRVTPELKGHTISSPWGELIQTVLFLTIGRLGTMFYRLSARVAFKVHGFCLRRYLKGHNIFHVKSGLGRGGAIRKAKKLGMKVLVDHCTPHPVFMQKSADRSGYSEWWSFWRDVMADCKEADILMVGSNFIRETFVENGYPEEKIRVVPLGVLPTFSNDEHKYSKSGTLQLIYTGGWKYEKGSDDLIDAIEILVQKHIDVHLTVVGSYSSVDKSVQRVGEQDLPVTFVGHVPQDKLPIYLSKADVFVFPSLYDGFAVSAFEGMAAGLCLLATRESSIPLRDGETGYVIPAKNGRGIASCIERLYAHREDIERVGKHAAHEVVQNYTWDRYAENVCKVYQELIEA